MPASVQQPVQQHAGAGAELAAGDPQSMKIAGAVNVVGIAFGCKQALLAAPQVNDRRAAPAQQRPGEWAVVAAGAVPQVDRGGVGGAAPDPGQTVEAAARADSGDAGPGLAQHDVQARVIAARQPQDRMATKQPLGRDIATSGDAGTAAVGDLDHARIGQVAVSAADS